MIGSGKTANSLNLTSATQPISATPEEVEDASSDGEIEKMESLLGDDEEAQKHLQLNRPLITDSMVNQLEDIPVQEKKGCCCAIF